MASEWRSVIALSLNVGGDVRLVQLVGWSGGAKVLGKLSVPGRPTILDYSRARAVGAGGGCLTFSSRLSFLSSFSVSRRWPDID